MKNQKDNKGINRRSFLRSTAAVGAGMMFSPRVFGQAGTGSPATARSAKTSSSADDINVALLGLGEQGNELMNDCLKIPGVRIKAVCDIWEAYNLRRKSQTLRLLGQQNNPYVDYQDMLAKEKDLDAVIIATPDFWHAEHTIACLKAGLHVYCEKEMSNKLEDARKMVQAAKETGKLLQIGHQRRSNPRYIFCYEKLLKDARILGRVTTVNGQWNKAAREPLAWPVKAEIDKATLEKYGFESMQQFRNWRWYRNLGGGPIVDLGSHQIDVYSWFLEANPSAVIASGGTDYYDKKTHQWYDTVMAVYEYQTKNGTVRASYQTLTTNSCWGYFERFMGDQGTLEISESKGRCEVYPEEVVKTQWQKWVDLGYLSAPELAAEKEKKEQQPEEGGATLDVRESPIPPAYQLPITMDKPYHQPHLENFFDAIRGKVKLTCPAEVGYETAVTVLKVNEAVEAARRLEFKPDEFKV